MLFIASHARKIFFLLIWEVEHNKNVRTIKTNSKIPFAPTNNKGSKDKATKSEIFHVKFLVHYNITFAVVDYLTKTC